MFKPTKEDLLSQIDKVVELLESITYQVDNNTTLDHVQLHTGYKLLHDSINNLNAIKRFFDC